MLQAGVKEYGSDRQTGGEVNKLDVLPTIPMLSHIYMGLIARKPVFGVANKTHFKSVSSATPTS